MSSAEPSCSEPDWSPFRLCPDGEHAESPRAITSREGIGDRMRAAAFAELQANRAFLWGAEKFTEAPAALRSAWQGLALAEERHLHWLLRRMNELEIDPAERAVSRMLWLSLMSCKSPRDFALYMAGAEERGRQAGVRFHQALLAHDPITAEIFRKIAEEEVEHIRLADRFYPGEKLVPAQASGSA